MPATCDVDMNTSLVKRCELQVFDLDRVLSCGGGQRWDRRMSRNLGQSCFVLKWFLPQRFMRVSVLYHPFYHTIFRLRNAFSPPPESPLGLKGGSSWGFPKRRFDFLEGEDDARWSTRGRRARRRRRARWPRRWARRPPLLPGAFAQIWSVRGIFWAA